MKALLLSEIFPPKTGGSGRWFWEIYRRISRDEVVVVAGEDPRQEQFDRTHDLRLSRLPLEMADWGTFSLKGLWNYRRIFRAVRKVVRREGVDQIHCGRLLPEGWIARMIRRRYGVPYLCYVHGEEMSYGQSSRQLGQMMHGVLEDAQVIIANSRNSAAILRDQWKVPADRVRVMHPGVDVERFVPAEFDTERRECLGWYDRPVVLTVGRLQQRKGQDQMIRALPAVRQSIPNVLYAIVGEGQQRSALEELVREHGLEEHVEFLGEPDDQLLVACYQQCDLFSLPNRNIEGDIEGFGMVLLEAQACAKPVVAGASGGTAETMRVPETGRLVNCDGPDELAATVTELLANRTLRDEMGEAGRRWVIRRFSWDSLARQAVELFEECMRS